MTMVILVILAMVWLAVLGPGLLRRRAERRSTYSVDAFHRQLHVLGRAAPSTIDPAYRLETEEVSSPFRPVGAHALRRQERRPDPYFRPEACKRRRDVLFTLLCTLVGTGLLGAVPAMRPLLYVTLVGALLLTGYLGLLVRLRTLALEREVKLHYLPQPIEHESLVTVRRAAAR
ncbi:MAG: hypothetical protein ACYDD4_11770 [Acidimicrobiales bacterium]